MSNLGWNKRPSNTKASRISVTQYLTDLGGGRQSRQSRSVERQSKIPLRASSQSGRERPSQAQTKQRSKSQVSSSVVETPLSHGKFTPNQGFAFRITPGASSNISGKKNTFYKDVRKLQDKEFLKEASQLVQTYFQEKCPEILINNVDIRPMTIKMFIAMINYLFEVLGILDKGVEPLRFTVSTYEKELPYWMKKLEYPGLITKAWLQTVNVPQYWPHVVGLLSWLVKLCTVNSMFSMEEQLTFPPSYIEDQWAAFFFKKAMEAFRFYNEGKEEEYKQICTEVINKFREINGAYDGIVTELEEEIAELKEKLEDPLLLADKDAFDQAEQHVRVLQSQQQKILDDIAKKEIDIEELKGKKVKKEKNCSILKGEIEETKKNIEKLKMTISMQSMSVEDIADIEKKTDYLDKEIKCLEKECEDYCQLISRYELESAGVRDKILQSSHAFNRSVIQLEQMVPELKKFHIHVDPDDEEIVEEMEKMVKSLENLKNIYLEKHQKLEEELIELQQSIANKKLRLNEVQVIITNSEKKIEGRKLENEKLKKTFEEREKALKEKLEEWNEKIQFVQEKIKELNDLKDKKKKLKLREQPEPARPNTNAICASPIPTSQLSPNILLNSGTPSTSIIPEFSPMSPIPIFSPIGKPSKSSNSPDDVLSSCCRRKVGNSNKHETVFQSLKQKELFWNDFWEKVESQWKVIPSNLECLLDTVIRQNKELEGHRNK